jgi:hypothetical protein
MVETRRRTSFLGFLALVAGIVGLALTRFDASSFSRVTMGSVSLGLAVAVSLGALAVAVIAFIIAASSPRTGTGLPMAAVLVCGAAVALAYYPSLMSLHAKTAAPPPPPPGAVSPTPDAPVTPSPTADNPDTARQKTIFDTDYPSSKVDAPQKPAAVAAPDVAEPTPSAPKPAPVDPAANIRAAKTRLDAAREAAVRSLDSNPGYQAAKAESDQADADLRAARLKYEPGSPELITASQAALRAHGKLQQFVTNAMATDPVSVQAQQELHAAQSTTK